MMGCFKTMGCLNEISLHSSGKLYHCFTYLVFFQMTLTDFSPIFPPLNTSKSNILHTCPGFPHLRPFYTCSRWLGVHVGRQTCSIWPLLPSASGQDSVAHCCGWFPTSSGHTVQGARPAGPHFPPTVTAWHAMSFDVKSASSFWLSVRDSSQKQLGTSPEGPLQTALGVSTTCHKPTTTSPPSSLTVNDRSHSFTEKTEVMGGGPLLSRLPHFNGKHLCLRLRSSSEKDVGRTQALPPDLLHESALRLGWRCHLTSMPGGTGTLKAPPLLSSDRHEQPVPPAAPRGPCLPAPLGQPFPTHFPFLPVHLGTPPAFSGLSSAATLSRPFPRPSVCVRRPRGRSCGPFCMSHSARRPVCSDHLSVGISSVRFDAQSGSSVSTW